MSFGVFGVINRISMKNSFVGDRGLASRTWPGSVELLVVPSGAFLFAGAIEGCFSSWNGGRRCWDLYFLDAQTGTMNSMKMTRRIGN